MDAIRGIIDPLEQNVLRMRSKEIARLQKMVENREITMEEYVDKVQKLGIGSSIN